MIKERRGEGLSYWEPLTLCLCLQTRVVKVYTSTLRTSSLQSLYWKWRMRVAQVVFFFLRLSEVGDEVKLTLST